MNEIISRLLKLTIQIQQIPAPTFHERERAEFIRARFLEEGLQDVETDAAGNVYARLPAGRQPPIADRQPLIVTAHLDTVFPAGTDLATFREGERIYGPGIGDNSLGVAGLFGLLWLLRQRRIELPFDLWLAANVCEEGLGDLRGMKAVVERFGENARAYIILEGMALGYIYHRGLGVRRYRVSINTPGGHSWVDYGKPSAVHELTRLAARLTRLEVPQTPRTTLNVGVISGGTSVNTIAAQASFDLDLRSEDPAALENVAGRVERLCRSAGGPDVEVKVEIIGARPAGGIPAAHPLVTLSADCLRAQGVEPKLSVGSTDANAPLSRGLPAVTLGLTTGGGAHTTREYIHLGPLEKGLEALVGVVRSLNTDY
jgi:acetylornithine deacetylase/succinyl-diaminopimelate desuccinylase-like protein